MQMQDSVLYSCSWNRFVTCVTVWEYKCGLMGDIQIQLIREGHRSMRCSFLASIQTRSLYHPRPCCCDLRELKHVQQQQYPQKGLMVRVWVDTVSNREGERGGTHRQTEAGKGEKGRWLPSGSERLVKMVETEEVLVSWNKTLYLKSWNCSTVRIKSAFTEWECKYDQQKLIAWSYSGENGKCDWNYTYY